ncbi:hypothetical protein [Hirschia baltica]|uniref:Uncharacterized protein n=1 Tax=Hirschia baltica (strain ATCC 49814 / DSM 5838 / IFAM 1418) TaxID=582402 RepID=C6XNR8_HIRBI|nr:hypothetical protein [Hirschia baltica]ACT58321.1 conserved hypothetical protein [Hirschia baltica ATCC 49814]
MRQMDSWDRIVFLDKFDVWRLSEELSIKDSALLINWYLPEQFEHVEGWGHSDQPSGYLATRNAICGAIRRKKLNAQNVWNVEQFGDLNAISFLEVEGSFNVEQTMVLVDDLVDWLKSRRHFRSPFFAESIIGPAYLDKSNNRYAPKLAAAVKAWEALEDQFNTKLSPKQNLQRWLRLHANEYGLADDDGKPRESTIEEIAKIANWSLIGGAPKVIEEIPVPKIEGPREDFSADLDGEIPF